LLLQANFSPRLPVTSCKVAFPGGKKRDLGSLATTEVRNGQPSSG
jgi:hypothetical protein